MVHCAVGLHSQAEHLLWEVRVRRHVRTSTFATKAPSWPSCPDICVIQPLVVRMAKNRRAAALVFVLANIQSLGRYSGVLLKQRCHRTRNLASPELPPALLCIYRNVQIVLTDS